MREHGTAKENIAALTQKIRTVVWILEGRTVARQRIRCGRLRLPLDARQAP